MGKKVFIKTAVKAIKKIVLLSGELLGNEKVKKKLSTNAQALLTDDQIVQKIIVGYDERQLVVIALTNKKLYVIGDTVLHEVVKDSIEDIVSASGMLSSLIEVHTAKDGVKTETVFFKVFRKKAITTMKNWLNK